MGSKAMSEYKSSNEFLPYHPQASHIPPDYRDAWNDCYKLAAAKIDTLEREKQVSALEYLALEGQFREHLGKIEALQLENESLKQVARFETDVAAQAIADFDEAKGKIEALEKDAKRYQWLRDEPAKGEAVGIALMFLEPNSDGVGSLMPAECDKRIDAAIKGEQAA
jgi:hypothetical protein